MIAGAIALEFICTIISGMLILGAVKGRRNFLLPWLIYMMIVILATTAAAVLAVVMLDTMLGVSILVVGILQLCKLIIRRRLCKPHSTKRLLFVCRFYSVYDLVLAGCVQLVPRVERERSDDHQLACRGETLDLPVLNYLHQDFYSLSSDEAKS